MQLPTVSRYAGKNTDATHVVLPTIELYFSYATCVAFRKNGVLHVCENEWGQTTGKHIKAIYGIENTKPYPRPIFEDLLKENL